MREPQLLLVVAVALVVALVGRVAVGAGSAVTMEHRACLAIGAMGEPLATKVTIRSPVEGGLEPEAGHPHLAMNADMVRHLDVPKKKDDGNETESQARDVPSFSCCGGLACPYEEAVCCGGGTHCCPAGQTCSEGYPPRCEDAQHDAQATQAAPSHVRVTKVKVFHNDTHVATVHVLPVPSNTTISTTMGIGADDEDTQATLPPATGGAAVPGQLMDSADHEVDVLAADEAEEGAQWPPMAAFTNDGTGATYVTSKQRDWSGDGLVRNGTFNLVGTAEECTRQCTALPECRVARFTLTNGECWLDSEVSPRASPCPLVMGRRNCESHVKSISDADVARFPFPLEVSLTQGYWRTVGHENWVASSEDTKEEGGRLIRNGKRNIVRAEADCTEQCANIRYCAVAMYLRQTGECWLSSRLAEKGTPCAERNGVRDCVSYVKKHKSEANAADRTPVDADSAAKAASSTTIDTDDNTSTSTTTATSSTSGGQQHITVRVREPETTTGNSW